jgi:hypothetical protein
LLIPGSMLSAASPKLVLADAEPLRWTQINTPGASADRNDIVSPSEVNRIAIGADGSTFYAVDIANANRALYKSTDSGISWDDTVSRNLYQAMTPAEQANFRVWNVAIAPDDVDFIAVVTSDNISNLLHNVWFSRNGGVEWQNTNCPTADNISALDVSMNYGSRDIAIGTRTGTGGGSIWILKAPDYNNWMNQGFSGDILSLKFSPNYGNDSALAVVYADATGTYLNLGIHDPQANTTNWTLAYGCSPPEVAITPGTSPGANQIISTDLELPSDFSGQSPSLRRYYVSTDYVGFTGSAGIYRIDDAMVYQLMSSTTSKRISGIAYYGSYASGKLLAGEVLGDPCSAMVMTWFTDSPTACPIPCWYPAMKPLTGAAGTDNCTGSGYGNTQIAWSPDGTTAYAGTASSAALVPGAGWPTPYLIGEDLDESAFSLTRNNGETWNQLSLIDTEISQLVDIAPAADCSTLYLASISDNVNCAGFDSVWRSQSSPLGASWERVLCVPTTDQRCAAGQTYLAILRLASDKADGQVVSWAAVGTRKIMWSSDYGDYWTDVISPALPVQDMAIEDSSTLYTLSADGLVQKFTFNDSGWTSNALIPTGLDSGYSIATAYTGLTPDNDKGHIIVGSQGIGVYDVAYSADGGTTFTPITAQLPTRGHTMVVASSGYKSSGDLFAINTGGMYQWSIYYGGGTWSWPLPEKDRWSILWGGPDWPTAVTGLTVSRNGSFYFSDAWGAYVRWSFAAAGLVPPVIFGTEPTTSLRICGGLASGDPIFVWLIDQQAYSPPQGGVREYIDDLSWNGPTPTSPISNATVKYDPVSGRAGEIDLTWQPVSLSRGYRIQIAKDEDFTLRVADIGADFGHYYVPPDLNAPALFVPPGGGTVIDSNGDNWTVPALEAGHTYYWRVMTQDVVTGDYITSPWSWREIFTIQAGLPAGHRYYGLQLLSPDNGCLSCPVKPAFSWSPFRDTQKYRFVLAKDAAMTNVIADAEVPTTSYSYDGALDYGTAYFWRVRAVEPFASDWSATFCFQTEPEPTSPSVPHHPIPPWVWTIIVVGLLIDIYLFIIFFRRLI